MKPVWSPKTVPNTSRVVTFKYVLCLLLSKLAERRNQPRGVSKACQRKTLSALSSKPLFLLIRLLNSLSSYIFRSLIIRRGHLFLINILLSLTAAGRTQPVGEEQNPPLCVCAGGQLGNKYSIMDGKTRKNNKGDAGTGEPNSPPGRLLRRPSAEA